FLEVGGHLATALDNELRDCIRGALSKLASIEVDATHTRVCSERNECRLMLWNVTSPQAVFLFGEDYNGAALRGLIGEARQLRRIGQFFVGHTGDGKELRGLTIAQRDRAGLVEKQ